MHTNTRSTRSCATLLVNSMEDKGHSLKAKETESHTTPSPRAGVSHPTGYLLWFPEEIILAHDSDEKAHKAFDRHGNQAPCDNVPFKGWLHFVKLSWGKKGVVTKTHRAYSRKCCSQLKRKQFCSPWWLDPNSAKQPMAIITARRRKG